jgi:NAD(P)-dependent dehydrogenase (short-subunit alcohol dehydrogenase family)
MNLQQRTAIFTGGNSAAALTIIVSKLAKLGARVAIDSVPHTRFKGACTLMKTALLASTLAVQSGAVCLAEDKNEDMETLMPAITVSKDDANELREINKLIEELLDEEQKILAKEGLEQVSLQLPKYSVISENSVGALINQIDYTNLAVKLGAPLPPRPDLPTGTPFSNNLFLHAYNNLILRSIAQHIGLPLPDPVDLSEGDQPIRQNFLLVRQNLDLILSIGEKRGSLQP